MDLTPFAQAKSDRLTADDLIGGPRVVTITGVTGGLIDGKKQAIVSFEGDEGKPFMPCKTMVRVMMSVWGKYASEYVGKSLLLYRDPEVTFGGLATGGVRIRQMSHMDGEATIIVAEKKGRKAPIKIQPLVEQSGSTGFTIDEARRAISAATTLDDLRTVWSRQQMRPHREALQAELDARKLELNDGTLSADNPAAAEGRADEDMGERITDDLIQDHEA